MYHLFLLLLPLSGLFDILHLCSENNCFKRKMNIIIIYFITTTTVNNNFIIIIIINCVEYINKLHTAVQIKIQ